MRWGHVVLLFALLGASGVWAKEVGPEDKARAVAIGKPRFDCTAAQAVSVTFDDLLKAPDTLIGKCVVVRGLVDELAFYRDLESMYDYRNQARINNDYPRLRVGIYVEREPTLFPNFNPRHNVELVAWFDTCERLSVWLRAEQDAYNEAHPDPDKYLVSTSGGWCHYFKTPVLYVGQSRLLDNTSPRLTGTDAAARHGDLNPLSPASPDFALISERVVKWFDAVRGNDKAALLKAADQPTYAREDEWPLTALTDPGSSVRFLIGKPALPPIKYFIQQGSPTPNGDFIAEGCMCKTADCEGQWPIHSTDARFTTVWPYVCVTVMRIDSQVSTD